MTRTLKFIGSVLAYFLILGGLQGIYGNYHSARPTSERLVSGAIDAALCAAGLTYLWFTRAV